MEKVMKKLMILGLVVLLSLALISCRELKELKGLLHDDLEGFKTVAAYERKVLIMFIWESNRNFWLNIFNFNNYEYICIQAQKEEDRAFMGYGIYKSEFLPSEWDDEQGLRVSYPFWGGETKDLTRKEFWEAVGPFKTLLLEQKKRPLDAMREAALEAGLIEQLQPIGSSI